MYPLLFLACVIGKTAALPKTFTGYELVSLTLKSSTDTDELLAIAEQFTELDFWTRCFPGRSCNMLVPPSLIDEVKAVVKSRGWGYDVIADDVQQMIKNSSTPVSHGRAFLGSKIDHTVYHSYVEIQQYLTALAVEFPDNVRVDSMPYMTHGYLPVRMVEIFGSNRTSPRPVIIIEAGIHAREWISTAANLYFLEKLVRGYASGSAAARQMLDTYDWRLIPVANPDGYEYSRTTNRMWRKNRRYINRDCQGVDLNRNFDSKFGTVGVSSQCSSDIYPGPNAFSEPETANIKDLVETLGSRLKAYLSVHAYSQFLLVPWGNVETVSRPDNAVELDRVGVKMIEALKASNGTVYQYGTAWELLRYAASGAAEDWALAVAPSTYAYCYELRPDAHDVRGFLLPASEIVATGEEYYASLAALAREMR